MGTIAKHVEMPAVPPGSPGLFRCAAAGYMAGIFRDAGLKNVTEKEVGAPVQFDSPEEYFTFMNEIAPPVVIGRAGGWNLPLRRLGGTTASMASSFSVGSART